MRWVLFGLLWIHPVLAGAASPDRLRKYSGEEWAAQIKRIDPAEETAGRYVPGLIEIVQDVRADPVLRRQAALMLGRIGEPAKEAVPLMITLTGAEEEAVALWALKSLAHFGGVARQSTPRLIALVHDRERSAAVRLASLEPLAAIAPADTRAVTGLLAALTRPAEGLDPEKAAEMRMLAVDSLRLSGTASGAAVLALVRTLNDEYAMVRRQTAIALGTAGSSAEVAIPSLVERLAFDSSPAVRDSAAEAIGLIGGSGAAVLTKLLTDRDPDIRWRAARGLGLSGTKSPAAIARLQATLSSPDPRLRIEAIRALWRLTGESEGLLKGLKELLASDDREASHTAFELLVEMGQQSAAIPPEVRRWVDDPDPRLRRVAREFAKKLSHR